MQPTEWLPICHKQGLIIIFVVAKAIFKFRRPARIKKADAGKEAANDAQ